MCLHTAEHCSTIKKGILGSFVAKSVHLETIMLSERNPSAKAQSILHGFSSMRNININKIKPKVLDIRKQGDKSSGNEKRTKDRGRGRDVQRLECEMCVYQLHNEYHHYVL